MKYQKYVPTYKEKDFYKINFSEYYDKGYRYILSDLDNTLVSYDVLSPTNDLNNKVEELKNMGFDFVIVSNSGASRVKAFASKLNVNFAASAKKPFTCFTKKTLSKYLNEKEKVLFVGDQLLTDIVYANNLGIDSILVDTISVKNQKFYTKINRKREDIILNYFKNNYKDIYKRIIGEIDAK